MNGLALYGAVLATITFLWEVAQWVRSRRVDVRLWFDTPTFTSAGDFTLTMYAVNFGDRPVFIQGVGLKGFDEDGNLWDHATRADRLVSHGDRVSHTYSLSASPIDFSQELRGFVEFGNGRKRLESPVKLS